MYFAFDPRIEHMEPVASVPADNPVATLFRIDKGRYIRHQNLGLAISLEKQQGKNWSYASACCPNHMYWCPRKMVCIRCNAGIKKFPRQEFSNKNKSLVQKTVEKDGFFGWIECPNQHCRCRIIAREDGFYWTIHVNFV